MPLFGTGARRPGLLVAHRDCCGAAWMLGQDTALPVQEYWHNMNFRWPHNEAIIATPLAHQLTGGP